MWLGSNRRRIWRRSLLGGPGRPPEARSGLGWRETAAVGRRGAPSGGDRIFGVEGGVIATGRWQVGTTVAEGTGRISWLGWQRQVAERRATERGDGRGGRRRGAGRSGKIGGAAAAEQQQSSSRAAEQRRHEPHPRRYNGTSVPQYLSAASGCFLAFFSGPAALAHQPLGVRGRRRAGPTASLPSAAHCVCTGTLCARRSALASGPSAQYH